MANHPNRTPVVFIAEPIDHPSLDLLREMSDLRLGRRADRYTEEELCQEVQDCDALMITSRDEVTRRVIMAAPRLRVISKFGSQPQNVDRAAAAERGIRVLYTRRSNTESVAEHTILLMLAVLRNLCYSVSHLRSGGWRDVIPLGTELNGKSVGLIGVGDVGTAVARKLSGFGVKLLLYDPHVRQAARRDITATWVPLDVLLRKANIVSIHAALTDETRGMIGEREFRIMRPNGVLINTARGQLVDQQALLRALLEKRLAGVGLDVFEHEPPPQDAALLQLVNVVATPHSAALTREAMDRQIPWAVADVKRVLLGQEPLHC